MTTPLHRLWPHTERDLDDDALVAELRTGEPVLRVNFVSSVDGAATHDGLSGGLSSDADKRYFELLRRASDAVVVGAGTVRAEGYGPLRVSDESASWRAAHGLPEHPVFVVVSRSLDLDPAIVRDAPVPPILVTVQDATVPDALASADVVIAGETDVDGRRLRAVLSGRGHTTVLCEGGPHLFASLLDDDAVDELCLTVSPVLEGGDGPSITAALARRRQLDLAGILHADSTLLLRYRRKN